MTTLNWENDRSRRLAKELAFDDLPRVGSYADRIRYGIENPSSRAPLSYANQRPSGVTILSPGHDFEQLYRYVAHARHADFRRKPEVQRTEIFEILRKLIKRCESWPRASNRAERLAIKDAKALIQTNAH